MDISGEAPSKNVKIVSALAVGTAAEFPMLERAWEMFSGKGIRTIFLSIGSSELALPDLEVAESLGCRLHAVPLNAEERTKWEEVGSILKARKRENPKYDFSEGAEKKWILPKNLLVQSTLPWWGAGELQLGQERVATEEIGEQMKRLCADAKIKDAVSRIDILKIDTKSSAPGFENAFLPFLMASGYRPAAILVNWNSMPDTNLATTQTAGHLQNCGYALVGKKDSKFLYYYIDNNAYEFCSWEEMSTQNPLLTTIARNVYESVKAAEKPKASPPAGTENQNSLMPEKKEEC
jgi:hypothetical protein